MNQKLLEKIREVEPYVPGEQPIGKVIKLNTNENPYPPSPKVDEALRAMNTDDFKLYPDPTCGKLVEAIAKHHKVGSNQVFAGVGSDDVLALCFLTFFNSEKPILFPDITYAFYKVWADLFQITYKQLPLDEAFKIVKEEYKGENGGIIFPNPNAPTGIYEGLLFVEEILKNNRESVVIVDEAYIDFAGESAVGLIEQYENLIVVQTYSKSKSMAGMRIGYAISNPTLIKYLNDAKYAFNSYTLNKASLDLGVAAIEDVAYYNQTVQMTIDTREWFKRELKMLGFEFPDSKGNFVFVKHPSLNAKDIFEGLKRVGIYVRYFSTERLAEYLRITIGTKEEMEQLLSKLKGFVK